MLSDEMIYFQRQVNTRKAKAVIGTPKVHRTKDGRTTIRRSFEGIDVRTEAFTCPDCKVALTPNVGKLIGAVTLLVYPDFEGMENWGVFIDQRGGAVVDLLNQ